MGNETVSSSVVNLTDLNLPQVWEREINKIIYNNRMLFELRIESASDYNELKERLIHKGYTNIPQGQNQMLNLGNGKKPIANVSSCKVQQTMIRKIK